LALSDVIPVLENLGFRVVSESAYDIRSNSGQVVWLHDFKLAHQAAADLPFAVLKTVLADAFIAIWQGAADNDAFNSLVGAVGLEWRYVVMLRAYASYMHQTLFPFSIHYIASALVSQADLTRN